MKYPGNNFTVESLGRLISQIDKQIVSAHQRALELYPDVSYQAMDELCVELGRLKVTLGLHLQLKNFELGIISNQEHISYLDQRLKELEDFYIVADESDTGSLENSILDIKKLLISIKKENYSLQKQVFQITVDESTVELIEKLIS